MSLFSNIPIKNIARVSLILPGFFLLWFLAGCRPGPEHKVVPAFYFWKTNLRTNAWERKVLQKTGTKVLYVRLFDIDWDERQQQPVPVGLLQGDAPADSSLQYIPVVYITQTCLLRLQEKDLPQLAMQMDRLIGQLCHKIKIDPAEVQIDCDWTRNSAGIYFDLLQRIKAQSFFQLKLLSCTIRLHQVKFSATSGIPPVDRGLLMVYNMGNMTRYGGQNSILDPDEAKRYLKQVDLYPLPLDVALPLYHWAILFERKQFRGILYNLSREQFPGGVLEHRDGNRYRLKQTLRAGGYLLEEGQEIRFEDPGKEALQDIADYLDDHMSGERFRLAFFHLDSLSMQPYTAEALNDIRERF